MLSTLNTEAFSIKCCLPLVFLVFFFEFPSKALASQCGLTPLEPQIWSDAFDVYHADYGGNIFDMATDGSNLFMCTAYGHLYHTTFQGVLIWAKDYGEECYALAVPPGAAYILNG